MLILGPRPTGRRFPDPSIDIHLNGPCTLQDLNDAIQQGRVDIVRRVLAARERLLCPNDGSRASALHKAVRNGNHDIVRLFLSKGTDMNRTSTDDCRMESPLGCSVRLGDRAMMDILLDSGATPHICDMGGRTPLYWAAHNYNIEIAETLILYGSNLDAADRQGLTPLHLACRVFGAPDKHKLIAILLNHGANPNRTTTAGLLPIDYAIKHNDIQTVRMLLEAGSDEGFEARLMMRSIEPDVNPVRQMEKVQMQETLKEWRQRCMLSLYNISLKSLRSALMEKGQKDRTARSILLSVHTLPLPAQIKADLRDFVGTYRNFRS